MAPTNPAAFMAPTNPEILRQLLAANANANATAKAPTMLTPFGSMEVIDDTLLHVLGFIIVLAAAHPLGMLFPRLFKLPLITGYLIVGILCGPFLANLLTTKSVQLLATSINAMALSFISFQAGQEIYLPELRPQIKGILQLLTVLYLTAMVLLTVVLTLGAGPFFYGSFDSSCKLAIALLFGSIAVLGSPATVMAIKIELNSVGPFTNLMLGATMTAEFVVLISFSVARVVSSVYCARLDITFTNLAFTMGIVFSNILVGLVIGVIIIAIFLIPGDSGHSHSDGHGHDGEQVVFDDDIAVLDDHPHNAHPSPRAKPSGSSSFCGSIFGSLYFKGFLWLFMGYIFYISTSLISSLTIHSFGHVWDVKFEPLLVLMVGSCLAGHHVKIRHDMHVILDTAAPFVFLPFFVMTGAALKLDQVANAIPLMSLFVGLRYVAIFLACFGAGKWILKLPPRQYRNLWLTMTPQAGVALGLANEIKELSPDPWAAEFAATIVAAVVVNQIIGPVLCAMGLTKAGESKLQNGHGDDGEEDTGKRAKKMDLWSDNELESGRSTRRGGLRGAGPGAGHGVGVGAGSVAAMPPSLAVIRRAVVIGDDAVACELALQLALQGAEVSMPLLDDDRVAKWEAIQDQIRAQNSRNGNGGDSVPSFAEMRALHHPQQQQPSQPPLAAEPVVSARSRVAMTEKPTDFIVFTGDPQRALDHVKMLHTLSGSATTKKPRLVAVLQCTTSTGIAQLDPLRNLGVICIQSSMALANLGLRVALLDDQVAAQASASHESGIIAEKPWLSTGSSTAELQRVLVHRRRVLHRNLQTTRSLVAPQIPYNNHNPQQGGPIAPQRVSMFGRSSVVEFLGTGRGGNHHQQAAMATHSARGGGGNFFVANDVYIMGGGQNGDGGFEDALLTNDSDAMFALDSTRSAGAPGGARAYHAHGNTLASPAPPRANHKMGRKK